MTEPVRQPDYRAMEASAGQACSLLKALANEVRLMVMCQLAEGEKSVSELQEAIGLSQSAMSQHLAVLRQNEIVDTRRSGQSVLYRIANADAMALMETLHRQFCESPRSG